jgi:hypothetical protein
MDINQKRTWQQALSRERGSHFENNFTTTYEAATRRMQEKYPGEYIVEEYYNGKDHRFDLRLKFATPEDEIMFLLKYE